MSLFILPNRRHLRSAALAFGSAAAVLALVSIDKVLRFDDMLICVIGAMREFYYIS